MTARSNPEESENTNYFVCLLEIQITREVNVFNFICMHTLFLQGLLLVPHLHSSVHSTFLPLHGHPHARELFSLRFVAQALSHLQKIVAGS